MSIQGELLDYLRSQVPARMTLSTRLGGDGRVCCYYICPFSTLRKIVEEGIRCRNSLPGCVDLSSPDVQSRRKTVWLGRSDTAGTLHRLRDVPIHSCVNLFWNPVNRTFDAFQRNGLLRAAEKNEAEDGIICLLELDAERLLNERASYWTTTKGNAASSAFASFDMSHLRQFPWANTYADGPYTQQHPWQPRAAELIVFLGCPGQQHSNSIPRSCVTRVLLSAELRLSEQQQKWLSKTGLLCQRADIFKPPSSLLESERLFVVNLANYCRADGDCPNRLAAAFRFVSEFESQFGGATADRFESQGIAHSLHGIGHVTRAMFWAAFLATYPFGQSRTNRHTAAILAALLHDLGRQKEWEDQGHGMRTLGKHRDLLAQVLDEPTLRESCASAVRLHAIADSECPAGRRDQLWGILKDADALERGRFRRPDSQDGRGCRRDMLRFGYIPNHLLEGARTALPWAAYQLAGMTKYSRWDHRSCRILLKDTYFGLALGLAHNVFQNDCREVAQRLHQDLSALRDEVAMQDRCEEIGEQLAEADAAYAEYVEAQEEEERLYEEEQKQEWQEWLDSDEDNDWDDHDMD